MFKIEAGKKYVCRNGSVVTLTAERGYLKGNGWVYSTRIPDKNCYRAFGHMEHPHDIVAPYVEKKPRKASSPYKKLLTAKEGDIFLLKGEKFKVEYFRYAPLIKPKIYLVSSDRSNNCGYVPVHVRCITKRAVFDRTELIDLLRSGEYVIE